MGIIRPQNMNDIFQAAAIQAKQKLPELTHNQKVGSAFLHLNPLWYSKYELRTWLKIFSQVARLYRNSLKTLLSWAVDRDIFNEKAMELRARFDASRGESSSAASRLLRVS